MRQGPTWFYPWQFAYILDDNLDQLQTVFHSLTCPYCKTIHFALPKNLKTDYPSSLIKCALCPGTFHYDHQTGQVSPHDKGSCRPWVEPEIQSIP